MHAFGNDPTNKTRCLADLQAHRRRAGSDENYVFQLTFMLRDTLTNAQLPEALAFVIYTMLDSNTLTDQDKADIPERICEAIPPGSDIALALNRMALWLLSDRDSPLAEWQSEVWMHAAVGLLHRRLAGDEPDHTERAEAYKVIEPELGSLGVHSRTARQMAAAAALGAVLVVQEKDFCVADVPRIIADTLRAVAQAAEDRISKANEPKCEAAAHEFFTRMDLPEDDEQRGREFMQALAQARDDSQDHEIGEALDAAYQDIRRMLFDMLTAAPHPEPATAPAAG